MERAAGWYKRKTQLVLFFLGLGIAVCLNVDSIAVARALWSTPALRAYTINAAEKYARDHPVKTPEDASTAANSSQGAAANTPKSPDVAQAELKDLQNIGLPTGWDKANASWVYTDKIAAADFMGKVGLIGSSSGFWFALIGWFLTALAMTLGAPFWFDTLNKFMMVRSTKKPQAQKETAAT
jgi:hypothetical protein